MNNLDANKINALKRINPSRHTKRLLVVLLAAIIFLWAAAQVYAFTTRVVKTWSEIQFAYEKPQLVDVMKNNYNQQVSKIESSMEKQQLSPEDKVLQNISNALNQGK